MITLTTGVFASEKNIVDERVKDFKDRIAEIGQFKIWQGKNLSKKIKLYNYEGELSAYLVNVMHKDNIIGYMLVNPKTGDIMEYALGQSPYSDYLTAYIKVKGNQIKGKKVTLLYDGPTFYGIALQDNEEDGKRIILDFTRDKSVKVKVDTMKYARPLLERLEAAETITPMGLDTKEKVLGDMPEQEVYHGCGPTAGFYITYYWDKNGYPNLITSSQTNEEVIDELADKMGTFSVGGGNYATFPSGYANGLEDYMNQRYTSTFYVSMITNVTYDFIINEIDSNRPGTLLYADHPTYGNHYVTFNGYRYDIGTNEKFYAIRDAWNTSTEVWQNWYYYGGYISHQFGIDD